MEYENEEALERVTDGEEVGERQGLGGDVEVAEHPREAQQNLQCQRALDPRTGGRQ